VSGAAAPGGGGSADASAGGAAAGGAAAGGASAGAAAPRIAVVIPSHARPLRLRWLLNALEEQTLPRAEFEVLVAHDDDHDFVSAHPLGARELRVAPRGPAAKRNAGWRAATAPLVAFTDDDCRPPPGWLANAVAAAERHPGAIVQGATKPDPDEIVLVRAPHHRTVDVDPPTVEAQTCNIVYPRPVLEACGGFDETLGTIGGEDLDLAHRARAAGVPLVPAPEVLTHHAVEVLGLPRRLRFAWRWRDLPAMVGRHPELRRHATLGVFWKPRHAWLALALAGAAARRPALALPWALKALPSYGPGPRGRLRAVSELPGQAAIDAVEMAGLALGSVRHRTLFL
jgi:GT2 family glycosyltransferase